MFIIAYECTNGGRPVTDEFTSCVAGAVDEQCGPEMASHVAQIGSRVQAACGHTNRWRRAGKLRTIYTTFFVKILSQRSFVFAISLLRIRWPGFDCRVAPLFHSVTTLGKLFSHCLSSFSATRNWGT